MGAAHLVARGFGTFGQVRYLFGLGLLPVAVVAGPYSVAAGAVYVAGPAAGRVWLAGADAGAVASEG